MKISEPFEIKSRYGMTTVNNKFYTTVQVTNKDISMINMYEVQFKLFGNVRSLFSALELRRDKIIIDHCT